MCWHHHITSSLLQPQLDQCPSWTHTVLPLHSFVLYNSENDPPLLQTQKHMVLLLFSQKDNSCEGIYHSQ